MGTDRLICKHCGNTEANKMDFSPDRRCIICPVGNSTTPLYND